MKAERERKIDMKTERTYEIDMNVDAAVAVEAAGTGRSGSEVVEEILRRDPAIAKILDEHDKTEPLPDVNPEHGEKMPA